jgi:hypothetical protein
LPPGELFVYREPVRGEKRVEEVRIPASDKGVIMAQRLEFEPVRRAPRGALDQAFRQGLFSVGYGPGYYAGFVDTHGMLAVAEPEWEVSVWEEVDGEYVEVAKVTAPVDGEDDGEGDDPATDPPTETVTKTVVVVDDDDDDDDWRPKEVWGAVAVGAVLTPFETSGGVRLPRKRVTANDADGWSGPLRGLDVRWHTFTLRESSKRRFNFPRSEWYFRTGYTQGQMNFVADPVIGGFEDGQATSLEYLTVPLFFGGHIYALQRFPIRPYVGLGAGFDVLRVQYDRFADTTKADVSARIGFELHAGVEIRITNYLHFTGEVMQLWSARRKIGKDLLPDFSNESFTVITGFAVGFPLHKRGQKKKVPRTKTVTTTTEEPEPHKVEGEPTRADPDAVKMEVRVGDHKTVVEGRKTGNDGAEDAEKTAPDAAKDKDAGVPGVADPEDPRAPNLAVTSVTPE